MKAFEEKHFHKLYGVKKQRINYQKTDFLDYAIMILICAVIIYFTYGQSHPLTPIGVALGAFMIAAFPKRHGVEWKIPIILKSPQDIVFGLLYKIQNLKPMYFVALAALLIENYLIYLTPGLPHHVELMRKIAIFMFYAHFSVICIYRTAILIAHLQKKELVEEVLMQSTWKAQLKRQPSVTLEIVHAYLTGVLTHIIYIAPWYFVITHVNYSLILLPLTCVLAVVIQTKAVKSLNDWFYRDHWLGHNAEFEFVYFHGSHHDAIPSGMIAVAGNGYLEGFFRTVMAFPILFFNPIMSGIFFTADVKIDIDGHQYIPGIFPKASRDVHAHGQHSIHHYGRIEPYGFGIDVDLDKPDVSEDAKQFFKYFPVEVKTSIRIDEQLNGFSWDNPRHKWYLDLVDKYQETNITLAKNEEV